MCKNIAVIGLGQMGSALALVAAKAGNKVVAVGTPQDKAIIDSCISEYGRLLRLRKGLRVQSLCSLLMHPLP